jgi:hypothetical protein
MCLPLSAFNDTSRERGYLHELLNVVRTLALLLTRVLRPQQMVLT